MIRLASAPLIAFFLAAAGPLPVSAADAPFCRNGSFADADPPDFRLATAEITASFSADWPRGCPAKGDACRSKSATVHAGTVLIVTPAIAGGWVCAFDQNTRSAGYVKGETLRIKDTPTPRAQDGLGPWEDAGKDGNRLHLAKGRSSDAVAADGEAYWPGRRDPHHLGTLKAEAVPAGNRLRLQEPEGCAASLTLLGPCLIVSDNRHRGGANVTFTSVYSRTAAR